MSKDYEVWDPLNYDDDDDDDELREQLASMTARAEQAERRLAALEDTGKNIYRVYELEAGVWRKYWECGSCLTQEVRGATLADCADAILAAQAATAAGETNVLRRDTQH